MRSARENQTIVDNYINELSTHSIVLLTSMVTDISAHISPFNVIPKKSQPGKWRLITYLLSPKGGSVNVRITSSLCSLSHPTVHHEAKLARAMVKGNLLAKLELKDAYRAIPVHPSNR